MRIAAAVLLLALPAAPQDVKRPRITGVAHIAIYAHDIEKSRAFYTGFLGYAEPFSLKNPDGSLALTFFKINDRQYIELFPETQAGGDRMSHISIETDNAEQLRAYLASRGIKTPATVSKGRIGNSNFNVSDPDGHTLEFVQYEADGQTIRNRGKFMDDGRISTWMSHIGITVGPLEPAMRFYRDVLGFQETWRGGRDSQHLDWVNMKVPDGDDYLEFMLSLDRVPVQQLGVMHHICLTVPDMTQAAAKLESQPMRKSYTRSLEIRTGINRKRQMNLYDPDGTRTELMEPKTVDGVPTPSSTAPPPR